MNKKTILLEYKGEVIERLNMEFFKVKLIKNNLLITASVANSLRRSDKRWKRITQGDRVSVEFPPDDLKGRIVKLLEPNLANENPFKKGN